MLTQMVWPYAKKFPLKFNRAEINILQKTSREIGDINDWKLH